MTKFRITAKVPTAYQLSSLRLFGMEVINLPTGAYYSEQDFDTIEEARQYMIDRATHYYDWDEEALEAAIDSIMKYGVLTMDACTGRIDEVEEEEEEVEHSKYARKCSISGMGMNQGYCVDEGAMYIASEEDMLNHLRENTDYKSLQEAYDEGYCYYTEWEEVDEDEYYLADGTLVVIEAEVEMSAEDMEEERGIDMLEDDRQSNW